MSKLFPGSSPPHVSPAEQLAYYVRRVREWVHPASLARIQARVRDLNLDFSSDELLIIAALDTPARVQRFLDQEVYYNNDHPYTEEQPVAEQEETAFSPRRVLRHGRAHCFEGALLAYAIDFLHGYEPRWMLLEGSKDVDHNLVVYRDKHAVRWGCNAHSGYPHLGGRSAEFYTLRALAETYVPHYYSGYTNDPNDLTLVGYSELFDLTDKFGVEWMARDDMVWDIYYTFVDDTIKFYRLFTDSTETHDYPLIRALKEHWIETKTYGVGNETPTDYKRFINVNRLPPPAQKLWQAFWQAFDPGDLLPRGKAYEIEQQFFALTGTTPLDLEGNAAELGDFLAKGFKIEQLLTHQSS